VGFDRIKTFGQRQGSREAHVLDAEAGLEAAHGVAPQEGGGLSGR
jgi:hypothetical protein